ncbi:MAG TPA: indole-3-glycerol phosphate synthase TrpC [Syntrophobacteraceae bacterium]|nr:indole-3-glycerol phosphate synthase TrpC [Syntrophobacteraceae bacterium]
MADFLSKILERKKEELKAAAKYAPAPVLRLEAGQMKGKGALIERLATPGPLGMNVIGEIKRASPSRGRIRDNVDAAEYARKYELGGAAAVSVLTEQNFFCGSPEDLKKVKSAVSIPVLRKDFIICPSQIHESAFLGADAVLLIVRALSPETLRDLLALSSDIGVDALVEAHDENEFETAAAAGARLIGINNRDLETFDTDISTSVRLAGRAGPGMVLVAESGIHTRSDVERLLDAGIWNFLIGESLMRSDDPVGLLMALHGAQK